MQSRALLILHMLVCHCTCKSSIGTCASHGLDVHATAVACSSSAVALQHDGLQQEEADAVAALLAAASGLSSEDMNASTPYPSGLSLPHPCVKASTAFAHMKGHKPVATQMHIICHWLSC